VPLPLDATNTSHDHNNITGHLPLCKAELLLQLYPLYGGGGGGGDSYNPLQNHACAPLHQHLPLHFSSAGSGQTAWFYTKAFSHESKTTGVIIRHVPYFFIW